MTLEVAVGAGLLPPGLDLSAPKRRLYEAALALFGVEGFHAVSIRDIANALGQQPSAIYFHVASKEMLLFELATIGHRSHFETLRDAMMDAGSDPADQLRDVVTAHIKVHLEYPAMARLTNRELRALDDDHYAQIIAIRRQAEQVFIDVIERGVRLGAFSSTDAFLDAKTIGAMGIRIPEWFGPDSPRTPEQIIERYVTNALKVVT